jgi:hypothetical protein
MQIVLKGYLEVREDSLDSSSRASIMYGNQEERLRRTSQWDRRHGKLQKTCFIRFNFEGK